MPPVRPSIEPTNAVAQEDSVLIHQNATGTWKHASGTRTAPIFRGFSCSGDGRLGLPDTAWEAHKGEIKHLYIDENKTLAEVIIIMKARGFPAT